MTVLCRDRTKINSSKTSLKQSQKGSLKKASKNGNIKADFDKYSFKKMYVLTEVHTDLLETRTAIIYLISVVETGLIPEA